MLGEAVLANITLNAKVEALTFFIEAPECWDGMFVTIQHVRAVPPGTSTVELPLPWHALLTGRPCAKVLVHRTRVNLVDDLTQTKRLSRISPSSPYSLLSVWRVHSTLSLRELLALLATSACDRRRLR